jgi:hypothetical protein|tara:strand:+ start:1344 stop:1991 length:648 start_codon:yes stop_codon:yes gene_type:complete
MNKKNIYQKLHQACLDAKGVKKGNKVNGMHFHPLEHDATQDVAVQALLDNGLYPTCSYLTEITDKNMIMVICTMKVHDVDDPSNYIIVDGCSAMGALDKFGTGQAMSYSRKYAFLNLLNLKTGIKDDDGFTAKPFKKISSEKSVESNPQYTDDNVNVDEIKDQIKRAKTISQLNMVESKYSDQIQYLIKNNLRAYRQISDIAETHEIKLNSNNKQ